MSKLVVVTALVGLTRKCHVHPIRKAGGVQCLGWWCKIPKFIITNPDVTICNTTQSQASNESLSERDTLPHHMDPPSSNMSRSERTWSCCRLRSRPLAQSSTSPAK